MDAIQFLKQEHVKAKDAFAKVLQASPQERGKLWRELEPELAVHEKVEEACLYGPISQDAGSKDAKLASWPQHHKEEVQKVEALFKEIRGIEPSEPRWLDKVKQVHQSLEHHIGEEEQQIFPAISHVWDKSKLDQAGEKMAQMKGQQMHRAA